jgi:hypothetical protein
MERKIDPKSLTQTQIEFLNRQAALLDLYETLSQIAEDSFVINTLLNLNKELGEQSSDVDYVLARYKKAMQGDVPDKGIYFSFDYKPYMPSSVKANINSVNTAKTILDENLLFYGSSFENVFENIDNVALRPPNSKTEFESRVGIRKEFLNFLIIKSYSKFNQGNIDINNLSLIQGRLVELYEANKDKIIKYPFGQMLTRIKASRQYPYERVGIDSFKKLDARKKDDIMDSFGGMLQDPETREFASNLLSYIATHDNFRFIGQSAVSFMRPSIFNSLNEIVKGTDMFEGVEKMFVNNKLNTQMVAEKLTEDKNFLKLFKDFLSFWYSDNRNNSKLRYVGKYVDGKCVVVNNEKTFQYVDPKNPPLVAKLFVEGPDGNSNKIPLIFDKIIEGVAYYTPIKKTNSSWKLYQLEYGPYVDFYNNQNNKAAGDFTGTFIQNVIININKRGTSEAIKTYLDSVKMTEDNMPEQVREAVNAKMLSLKGSSNKEVTTQTTTPTQVTTPAPVQPTGVIQATEYQKEEITKRIATVINESAKRHLPKEQFKTKQATQFIGDGSPKSSTDNYKNLYAEYGLANTGQYNSSDLIYVSSNGSRSGRVNPVENGVLQGQYENIDTAIKAGASFIMDTADHLEKTKGYNIGEIALADYFSNKGYAREDSTGIWKPAVKPVVTPTVIPPVSSNGKYIPNFININGKNIEVFKWENKEKVAIALTADQDKAVRKIIEHIENKPGIPFILKGKAGTGKTTVIRVINEYFDDKRSVIITPTHKAGKNASIVTFGNTQNKYRTFAASYYRGKGPEDDVIIFDEISMLGEYDKKEVFDKKIDRSKTYIFMGDQRQLPPIKSRNTSPFFVTNNASTVYELTEVMRFDQQGSIFKIADKFAENLKMYNIIKQYPEKLISDKDAVYSVDSSKRLIDSYIHFYRQEGNDPSKVRLIAYGNKTVEKYNNEIRNVIFKGEAQYNIVNNNDLLTGNMGWSTKDVLKSPMVNSSEYKVIDNPKKTNRNFFGKNKVDYNFMGQLVTFKEIVSDEFGAERTITIIDPQIPTNKEMYSYIASNIINMKNLPNNLKFESSYNEELNNIEKSGIYSMVTMYAKPSAFDPESRKVLSVDLYTLDEMIQIIKNENPNLSEYQVMDMIDSDAFKQYYKIEPNVSFGYAITTHKSQGSTYKHVMVDEANMSFRDHQRLIADENEDFYAYEANQMRYVGFSRPTTTLVIYTKKPIGNELIYETESATLPNIDQGMSSPSDDTPVPAAETYTATQNDRNNALSLDDLFGDSKMKLNKSLYGLPEPQDAGLRTISSDVLSIVINKIKSNFEAYKDVLGIESVEQIDNMNSSEVATLIKNFCKI